MIWFTWITYTLYIYFVLFYLAKIFGTPIPKPRTILLVMVINSFLVYFPIYILKFQSEWCLMLIYFIIFGVEIGLIYNQSLISTLAVLLCFTLNYFGTKIFFIGLLSLIYKLPVSDYIQIPTNQILITLCTFGFLILYIMVSSKILIYKVAKHIFSDNTINKLSCALLSAVCINQLLTLPTLYITTIDPIFNSIYQIRSGSLALICFIFIMIIVYLYSKLKEASLVYASTSAKIRTNSETLNQLEKEVTTDFTTGLFVRSVAIKKLETYISSKVYCYVLFLDLDGLKTVNDRYGHEEGDRYIKEAAFHINEIFSSDTISRIGGDEFLIVGNNIELPIKEKIDSCYTKINMLETPYDTSISYGYVEIDSSNSLSHDQLIKLADEKMYAFKKSRNKERKDRNK